MENINKALNEFLTRQKIKDVIYNVKENNELINGDYSCNICFKLIKKFSKSPYEIGCIIKENIEDEISNKFDIVVSENGYINFYTNSNNYKDELKYISNMAKNKPKNIKDSQLNYFEERISNILGIYYLENEAVYIDWFDKSYLDKYQKMIIDIIIECSNKIKVNENIFSKLNEIYKVFYKYEEETIIKYLEKEKMINLIILLESIQMLIFYNEQ